MKKLTLLSLIAGGILLLASCSSSTTRDRAEAPAIPVTVRTAKAGHNATLSASGRIEAQQSANISTRMMGHVTGVHVRIGDAVKQGQLMATISSVDLEAQRRQVEAGMASARAAFNSAKKDLERFTALFEKQSATSKELDDITTHYEMAKAGLQAAERMRDGVDAQFAYTRIKAPFDGIVTNTFLKEGEMANPGMPILALEGHGAFQAVTMVPESNISKVAAGMPVTVTIRSLGHSLQGTVAEVSASARNTGSQYMVKVDLPKVGDDVLSGMFVDAAFNLPDGTERAEAAPIQVPREALVRNGQLEGIYVVTDNDVALLRWLRLGHSNGSHVEVLSGLAPDERYVLTSEGRLFNGSKVILQEG